MTRAAGMLVLILAWLPVAAHAQPAGKVPRIGLLASTNCSPAEPALLALAAGLRAHGYEQGKNLIVLGCEAGRPPERFHAQAARLVRERVDAIVGTTWEGITAAREATSTIPIVMASVVDPVALGFVETLARPGGNVTGVASPLGPLLVQQIELLKEAVPSVSRLAVLINPGNPTHSRWKDAELSAQRMGLSIQPVGARVPGDLEGAVGTAAHFADALLVLDDPIFFSQRRQLAALVNGTRLIAMYTVPEQIEAGGLIGYGPGLRLLAQRAAVFVDRTVGGARPAELAGGRSRKLGLAVNLRTARALGPSIPRAVVQRADLVIE